MIFLLIVFGIFLSDYLIKEYVLKNCREGEKSELFGGRVILRNFRNSGFAMSAFQKHPNLVKKAAAAVNAGIAVFFACGLFHPGNSIKKLSLAMIIGGGLSNLYDRCKRGYVVDYVSFRTKWKKLTSLVFNISDFFIIGGSVLYCISQIIGSGKTRAD